MNIITIIEKKKDKQELSEEEIKFFVEGYVNNEIADYQISSLLMAIVLNGMSVKETSYLTNAMIDSGDTIDLSEIEGIKVDKHSTGGVGDKVSLVLAPLIASAGAKVAKMSGRGLGHTGGTLDKLEAIPGYDISLSTKEFIKQVQDIDVAIVGQTGNLVPADKKIYALRDVSGTVQSIPLIASSIMSKKIACGANAILLDVKVGQGAFMKDQQQAQELAKLMSKIGNELDRNVVAVITDMNKPLGYAIGNSLEVIEAIDTLKGNGPKDLEELCLKLGSIMLVQANIVSSEEDGYSILKDKIANQEAYQKFIELVEAQHGDIKYIKDTSLFVQSKNQIDIIASKDGYLTKIEALKIGKLALELGAGRHTKEDDIDYSAGIYFKKTINDEVRKGDLIAVLHTNKENNNFIEMFNDAIEISSDRVEDEPLIKEIIR